MYYNLRMKMRASLGLFIFFFTISVFAQVQNPSYFIASPPSPVGSGARAMGVGGAFIAVADDGTAASWNPAALIQLELPEASMVFTYDVRSIDKEKVDFNDVNYLSASHPFTIGNTNMIFSFNYQRLYDFYASGRYPATGVSISDQSAQFLIWGDGPSDPPEALDYDLLAGTQMSYDAIYDLTKLQEGDVGAVAPAFAIQITPSLSLGISYNFWSDAWLGQRYRQEYDEIGDGTGQIEQVLWWDTNGDCTCNGGGPCDTNDPIDDPSCIDMIVPPELVGGTNPTVSEVFDFHTILRTGQRMEMNGQNFNLGILWDINSKWTLGAVYRAGFKMDVKRMLSLYREATSESDPTKNQPPVQGTVEYQESITFPSSYGIGVGYRYSDALSFTSDLTMVRWDEYYYKLADGTKYSPITGLAKGIDDVQPTLTFRAGGEYLVIKPKYVVPIRAGFFYDQEPAREKPDDYYGITLGSGIAYKGLVVDFTYFYRFAQDVTIASIATGDHQELIREEKGDVDQHMAMLSFIFHFE